MTISYVIHSPADGRLFRWGYCSEGQEDIQTQVGEVFLAVETVAGVSFASHYVVSGVLVERPVPALDLLTVPADGTTPVTLSGMHDPSTVSIDGSPNTITGGTTPIAFSIAGDYVIEVAEAFPYQPLTATVVAT